MKLKNSTDFSDRWLRRMVAWCCREIGLPVRQLRRAQFTNTKVAYRGRAWGYSRRILVRIGPAEKFPSPSWKYGGAMVDACNDRVEGLVSITAHELFHILQSVERLRRTRKERSCVRAENLVRRKFSENREALLAIWGPMHEPPEVVPPSDPQPKSRPDLIAKRSAKASKMLSAWERRLKMAKRKVAEYRRRARYYERKLNGTTAACSGKQEECQPCQS